MGMTPRFMICASSLLALGACSEPLDLDLRGFGQGFSTTEAVQSLAARPAPDDRGIISYPDYQVAVAQRGDTVRSIAGRIGLGAEALAAYNAVDPDVPLRQGEIIALQTRVAEPSPATGAPAVPAASNVEVTTLASGAIDRAEAAQPSAAPAATAAPAPAPTPVRHKVASGETAFSLARRYNVSVDALAQWNGLGSDLTIQEGRYLLIPQAGQNAPLQTAAALPATPAASAVTRPGQGTATPTPPSAAAPLPQEVPSAPVAEAPPAPDIGQATAAPAAAAATSSDAPLIYPVEGSIIRDYAPGRNEGIDIGATPGTPVKAAASGTVAAVTEDTNGVAIVVIKHADNILTVYTNLDDLKVAKGQGVRQGQEIAAVREGSPSFVHFEVRDGLESTNPSDFLP